MIKFPGENMQEAELRGQIRQEAIYHALQFWQKARDRESVSTEAKK